MKGAVTVDEREELRAILERLTDEQWEWFISSALPVLQELTAHAQFHPADLE